jgi:deoxyhypusine synthase
MSGRKKAFRDHENLSDGFEHDLEPLESLDPAGVGSAESLLRAMGRTAFGGRALGEAAEVTYRMTTDRDCFVVGTFSGAMTVAKMGLVLCEMIERGMVQAIVSTGALVAHGFVESIGRTHFKHDPAMDDTRLFEAGYNRVYDTLELERNLDDVEEVVQNVLGDFEDDEILSSRAICRALGRHLEEQGVGRGVLASAYRHDVPVYIPAFTDSELGLDVAITAIRRRREGRAEQRFDPFLDLDHYARRVAAQERLGLFTIGGGVPRNWAQQIGPYLEILGKRLGQSVVYKRFRYAVRICPEPAHWGGLSGCSYSEGVSWGKLVPKAEGGMWAEVPADATIAWPLLVRGLLDRLEREGKSAGCEQRPPSPPFETL